MGLPAATYAALTLRERATVLKRYRLGYRGEILLENLHGSGTKSVNAAKKYGLSRETYESLSKNQKANLSQRYRRGARGADLYKDLDIPGK
jgi:GTP cyclohydrolase II